MSKDLQRYSTRRCRVCGNRWEAEPGQRYPCPYTYMHEKALRGLGRPPANDSQAAVKLRTLAVKFTKHEVTEHTDRQGQKNNAALLAAARAYARVADHAEALLKREERRR